jgi:hypothetical protein
VSAIPGRARSLPRLAVRAFRHGLAYALACIAASAVVVTMEFAAGWGLWSAADVAPALLLGAALTFVFGLPVAVILIVTVRRFSWRSSWVYMASGAAAGLGALVLNAIVGGGLVAQNLIPEVMAGGVAGGAAYWFVAVRPVLRQGAQARGGVPA